MIIISFNASDIIGNMVHNSYAQKQQNKAILHGSLEALIKNQ